MTLQKLVNKLEKDYVENNNQMFRAAEKHNNLDTQYHVGICLYICDVLADINCTTQEKEMKRLYDKYNLWKM